MELLNILDNYNYVIFDFDGTIVKLHVKWTELKRELDHVLGVDFTKLNEGLKTLNTKELKRAFEIIEKHEHAAGYDVNSNLIGYIKKVDKHYAIFSDNLTSTVNKILYELGIATKFKIVIGKDSVSDFKPSGEGILKIIDFFSVGNDEIILVGDSEKDKIAAESVGIRFIRCNFQKSENQKCG